MFKPLPQETLEQHYKCACEILKPYACNSCSFYSQYKVYHRNHDHKWAAVSHFPTEHLCRKCKFRSHSVIVFTNHAYRKCTKEYTPEIPAVKLKKAQNVQTPKLLTCKQCPFQANRPNGLATHIKYKHSDPLLCNKCDFQTTQKTVFDKHVKVMHKEVGPVRWLNCNMCNFKTKSSMEFQDHVKRAHPTNALSKRCDLCGCQTRTNENYTYHMLSHQV